MARILASFVVIVIASQSAAAGQRCAKRPDFVLLTPTAQLDEDGLWHRRIDETQTSGRISQAAVARVQRVEQHATYDQAVRCLDALIADDAKQAAKACAVKAAKR